ncbi:2-succinyl-6-hydroxy-2,4-cyclohexadiene-1-carboxylate synthase [Psychromonas sp. MME2]|uniref:2-succinyl-6-hydroxy-2, 4-cyclohexadiene-1-carboxylate synthase n=1 Tax=unclassified Psychromonas TaxID=2614957 RepID=UPI00339CA2BA
MPLFYRVDGQRSNPTLVFLHGFLGNSDDWNETITQLKERFYCICIDLPGHGHSIATNAPIENGFAHCHRLIKKCLQELQVTTFTLVGYSLGGRIALDYARTQKDANLQRLILESSHIGLHSEAEKKVRYQHDKSWAKRFATQHIEQSLYEWYEQSLFDNLSPQQKDDIINKRSQNYGVCLAGMLLSTSLAKQDHSWDYLQNNSQTTSPLPIDYCVGSEDKKFIALAKQLTSFNCVNIIEFNGVGHNIHQQQPRQYAQFIIDNIHK